MHKISIVIPVYNEKSRLEEVLHRLHQYDEVIIIDDGSHPSVSTYINTRHYKNLTILENKIKQGYLYSIKRGMMHASGDIIVTMDGDGEHDPNDIEKLVAPIMDDRCDIVFGKRPHIARPSEKILLWMAKQFTKENVEDSGTGFRAIRATHAKSLDLIGSCTCGTLLMECHYKHMRICEVEVKLPAITKPRTIAWSHINQFFILLRYNIRCMLSEKGEQ